MCSLLWVPARASGERADARRVPDLPESASMQHPQEISGTSVLCGVFSVGSLWKIRPLSLYRFSNNGRNWRVEKTIPPLYKALKQRFNYRKKDENYSQL